MGTEVALIFGSIPCENWEFLQPFRGKSLVICADGGTICAAAAGFVPDIYIGDSDSGGIPPAGAETVLLPPEKDLTDLQAAYEYARRRGIRRVVLTACTGGRQDHHLANLALLETAWRDGVEAAVLDARNAVAYLNGGSIRIPHGVFRYFSVIPMDARLCEVRIRNARYPLDVPELRRGDTLTVSNETLEGGSEVRIGSGAAWIVQSDRLK